MCDAGFGLHFLAHWVRERGDFTIQEGIRRLTSHPADLYGIQNRGRLAVGAQADMLLFDPATVGISPAERVADLPGGGRRTIRRPTGVHGVFCNGIKTFDGKDYVKHAKGPGHVLDRFNASPAVTRCWRRSSLRSAGLRPAHVMTSGPSAFARSGMSALDAPREWRARMTSSSPSPR